uniref:Secreted protein n=1 Tax=Steinernema glaseri TaxID=37863 RepID=A0A1I7XVT9_9BILA
MKYHLLQMLFALTLFMGSQAIPSQFKAETSYGGPLHQKPAEDRCYKKLALLECVWGYEVNDDMDSWFFYHWCCPEKKH